MKKTLLLIVSFILTCFVAILLVDIWETTAVVQQEGRTGTLKIERQYNASRWDSPLPLKKINVYTATLAPKHAVIIETDQELVAGREYFIRFLPRDKASAVRERALRPIAGSLRARLAADGKPDGIVSTDAMDRALEKAMGDAPKGDVAAPATDHANKSVSFLIGGANDGVLELIWQNSTVGEWLVLIALLFLTKALLLSAWFTPWSERESKADRPKFIHPSLRRIDPDEPAAPPKPIALAPKSTPSPSSPPPDEAPENTAHPPLKLPRK